MPHLLSEPLDQNPQRITLSNKFLTPHENSDATEQSGLSMVRKYGLFHLKMQHMEGGAGKNIGRWWGLWFWNGARGDPGFRNRKKGVQVIGRWKFKVCKTKGGAIWKSEIRGKRSNNSKQVSRGNFSSPPLPPFEWSSPKLKVIENFDEKCYEKPCIVHLKVVISRFWDLPKTGHLVTGLTSLLQHCNFT